MTAEVAREQEEQPILLHILGTKTSEFCKSLTKSMTGKGPHPLPPLRNRALAAEPAENTANICKSPVARGVSCD